MNRILRRISLALLVGALSVFAACSKTSGMVLVSANPEQGTATSFYIDAFEASLKQKRQVDSTTSETSTITVADSKSNAVPASAINYTEAVAYCELAEKRICTTSEWLTACVGPDNQGASLQPTPTSPSSIDGSCYIHRSAENEDEAIPLVKTGALPLCRTSGLQVFDMIGNVSEWALDDANSKGLAMGPNAGSAVKDGKCSYTVKTDTNQDGVEDTDLPETENSEVVGFRCCLDVPTE